MPTPHATCDLPESEWNAVLHRLTPHEKNIFFKDLKLRWRNAMRPAGFTTSPTIQFPRDLHELPQDPTALHEMRPDLYNALFMPSGMLGHCPWDPVRLQQMAESVPIRSTHIAIKVHPLTTVLDAMYATVAAGVAMHGTAADAMHGPVPCSRRCNSWPGPCSRRCNAWCSRRCNAWSGPCSRRCNTRRHGAERARRRASYRNVQQGPARTSG